MSRRTARARRRAAISWVTAVGVLLGSLVAGVALTAPAHAEDTGTSVISDDGLTNGYKTYGDAGNDNTFYAYARAGEWIQVWGSDVANGTGAMVTVLRPDGTSTELQYRSVASRTPVEVIAATEGIWTITYDTSTTSVRAERWGISVYDGQPTPPEGKTWANYDPHVDGDAGSATRQTGRVWSENYMVRHENDSDTNDLRFYLVNDSGYLYRLTLAQFNGLNSAITATSIGIPEGGDGSASCTPSYRSWNQASATVSPPVAPCADAFRIFFEEPGAALPASAAIWDPVAEAQRTQAIKPLPFDPETADVTGWGFAHADASSSAGTLSYDLGDAYGVHRLQLDLDGDGDYDGPKDRAVELRANGEPVSFAFDGLDGEGAVVDRCTPVGARVRFDRVGEIHVVQADVEKRGSIELIRLNGPGAPDAQLHWDDTAVTGSRSNVTPELDGTAGVDSTGGVHGWGAGTAWATNGWGNERWIDDWAYLPTDSIVGVHGFGGPSACAPTISVVKSADVTAAELGDTIHYEIAVTNEGGLAVDAVAVADAKTDAVPAFDPGNDGNEDVVAEDGELVSIGPGGTAVFTATHTVTLADALAGEVVNTAIASAETVGTGFGTGEVPSNEVVVSIDPPEASIAVAKSTTATGGEYEDVIEYTIEVTNTSGNGLAVTDVVVTDANADDTPAFDAAASDAGVVLADGKASIPDGQKAVYRAEHTVTAADVTAGEVRNTARASGRIAGTSIPLGPTDSNEVEVPIASPDPVLNIVKSADLGTAGLGDTIVYTFAVTNNSAPGVVVDTVVVSDPKTTAPNWVPGHPSNSTNAGLTFTGPTLSSIAPGATAYFVATHLVTIADVEAGDYPNTASVSARKSSDGSAVGPTPSNEVTVTIDAPEVSLSVVKSTDALSGVLGETLSYDFAVTNSADSPVAAADVVVSDPKTTVPTFAAGHAGNTGVTVIGGAVTIAPGGTAHFAATHVVTPSDVSAGEFVNQASVTATIDGTTIEIPPVDSNIVEIPITDGPVGTVTVHVVDAETEDPVPGAIVTLVPKTGPADYRLTKVTPPSGTVDFDGVPAGDYEIRTVPPDGYLVPPAEDIAVPRDGHAEETIPLEAYAAPPTAATLTFDGDPETRDSGIPRFSPFEPVAFTVDACAGGAPATYTVTRPGDTAVLASGALEETPPGEYHAAIAGLGLAGQFVVHVALACTTDEIEALIYIDPAGAVVDRFCTPVAGATVRIDRSLTAGGGYTELLTGDVNLDPTTPTAPVVTGADGGFAWLTTPGFYQVRAEKGAATGQLADLEVTVAGGPIVGLVLPLAGHDEGIAGLEAPVDGPSISGTPVIGGTLTATAAWSAAAGEPGPIGTLGVQWTRDGAPIAGATGASYTPSSADAGHRIGATITAGRGTLGGAACASAELAAAAVLIAAPLAVTGVDPAPMLLSGLALLALGGVALVLARGRFRRA